MQSRSAAHAAWGAVVAADPADLDRRDVVELLRSIASVRAVCDAAEVLAVRRTRELSAAGNSESAENVLANQTGRSSRNARDAATREQACAAMPTLEAGLAAGTITAGHLDAAAAAHARLSEDVAEQFASHADDLLTRSQTVGVDAFERECRDLARHLTAMSDPDAEVDELERQRAASSIKRWVDKATGMHNTLISLDPLRDSMMWKVINHQVGREQQQRKADGEPSLPFTALQAQALVTAVTNTPATNTLATNPSHTNVSVTDSPLANAEATGASVSTAPVTAAHLAGDSPSSDHTAANCSTARTSSTSNAAIRLPEISILCDLDTLITGIRTTGTVCETDDGIAVPPATVRRLACDAKVIPILLDTRGEVLDQGRRVRTATPAQRNALAAMHRSCAFPGCTIGFSDCRIHHIRWWWEHHGRTDIDNLLPLCEKHHHRVHEAGWALCLDTDRSATWSRPDGSVHHEGTTIDRRPRDVPLRR